MNDPLQLPLRDIHLPGAVSWWPPAPGWWLLALIIAAVFLFTRWWYRRLRRRKYSACNLARRALLQIREEYADHRDVVRMIRDVSVLLRRVSISVYSRDRAAGLTGAAWLAFLDKPLGGTPFSAGAGRLLIDAPYRREVVMDEIEPLFQLCEQWLDAVEQQPGQGR